jgi:glycerate kinase
MRLVAAPDKFRGTIGASAAASAMAGVATSSGWSADEAPLSDGGEGFGDVFGGSPTAVTVAGPLGTAVDARYWMLADRVTAVVEMAEAAGRALLPHPTPDEAYAASTEGVGQLIMAAVEAGATTVLVGCGGSATTDGGWGAVSAILMAGGISGTRLIAATDVTTTYLDAASVFGPQKGADAATVARMERRLEEVGQRLDRLAGRSITARPRSGAAGGLAGGLLALGAETASGIDVVAGAIGLDQRLAEADLVITGEGHLDSTSLEGKTVSALVDRAPRTTRLAVVAGACEPGIADRLSARRGEAVAVVSLCDLVGEDRSLHDTRAAICEATELLLG